MSAVTVAPLLSTPRRRLDGTDRNRRVLRLVQSTPRPPPEGGPYAHLLVAWDRALETAGRALNAAEGTKVYAGSELLRRRRRLSEERGWLVRLRELGPSDPLPRFLEPAVGVWNGAGELRFSPDE
jgi:hypothetical protein